MVGWTFEKVSDDVKWLGLAPFLMPTVLQKGYFEEFTALFKKCIYFQLKKSFVGILIKI